MRCLRFRPLPFPPPRAGEGSGWGPRRRGHRMRSVIAAAALAVWLCTAVAALAQDAARLPLVGVLQVVNVEPSTTMLRDALKALGHIDGKTIRLDFRIAEGDPARLPGLATALVR